MTRGGPAAAPRTASAAIAALSAALLCAACTVEPIPHSPEPIASAMDFGQSRVRGGDNGLELVQWSVPATPAHVAEVLERHGLQDAVDPAMRERLARNGLHLCLVPVADLPATLADLGGTLADMRHWHGQVLEWREVVRVGVADGQPVFADGKVRALQEGSLRLSLRGYTLPMEDGGVFRLEMVPHAVGQESAGSVAMAARDRVRGDAFKGGCAAVSLRRDLACLVCADAAPQAAGGEGPDAAPPPSLGALLLPTQSLPIVPGSPAQERTTVLVLLARMPDALCAPMEGAS